MAQRISKKSGELVSEATQQRTMLKLYHQMVPEGALVLLLWAQVLETLLWTAIRTFAPAGPEGPYLSPGLYHLTENGFSRIFFLILLSCKL